MNAPANVMADPATLQWWAAALKGNRGPICADEPMTGYYRARTKNKQTGEERLFAVAYWWHNGKCFCKVNGPGTVGAQPTLQGTQLQQMIERWPYVSKEPVEYDVYQAVVSGKPWPDVHVAPKAAPVEASSMPGDAGKQVTTTAPAAGTAVPPAESIKEDITSPQAVLRREIDVAIDGIRSYVTKNAESKIVSLIDSDDKAGACQSLRAQLLTLSGKAKKAREEVNKPHQDAIKTNGLIWTPLETLAKQAADDLRDGPIKGWELHKREQQAAAAKATAAATQASGAPAQVASNAPAPAAKIKGATGRGAIVQEVKIAVIHDLDQVYGFFKTNEQLRAILQGLSNAAVRAGIDVPGATTSNDVSIK